MALYTRSLKSSFAGPRCGRCHRVLTDPVSIKRGIGPECLARQGRDADGDLCVRDQFSDVFDNSVPFSQALVLKRQPRRTARMLADPLDAGECVTNVPHLVVQHSPDGFEFGYGGSGPADLALNICQLYLNMTGYEGKQTKCYDGQCWQLAFMLHQRFKSQFIASAPKTGRIILFKDIDGWFKAVITEDLLEQCSDKKVKE